MESKTFLLISLTLRLSRLGFDNAATIKKLLSLSNKLNRLDCADCNGELEENENGTFSVYAIPRRGDKRLVSTLKNDPRDKVCENIRALLPEGVLFRYQGDPRGCSVYLYKVGEESREVAVCL